MSIRVRGGYQPECSSPPISPMSYFDSLVFCSSILGDVSNSCSPIFRVFRMLFCKGGIGVAHLMLHQQVSRREVRYGRCMRDGRDCRNSSFSIAICGKNDGMYLKGKAYTDSDRNLAPESPNRLYVSTCRKMQ